jgi:hypothetical protein
MAPSSEVPLSIRAIAIAYKFDLRFTDREISSRLSVPERTLRYLFLKAKQQAQGSEWQELLLYISDLPGRGRKPHIQPGSLESVAIREAIRSGGGREATLVANNTKDRPVLKELNPNIPRLKRTQVQNVLLDKRHCENDPIDSKPIKRLKLIHKPGGYEATTRLNYTQELAEYVQNKAIIVVCDEKKFSFGGTPNGRVSAPQGSTPYRTSVRERFVREQWAAATAQDVSILRPHIVWNADDKHDVQLAQRLLDANQQLKAHVEGQRTLATTDHTSIEAQLLRDKNEEVRLHNEEQKRQGKRGRKQPFTAERLFKHKDLVTKGTNLDFVWYAFRIY